MTNFEDPVVQVSIEKDQLPVQIPTATMTEQQLKILEELGLQKKIISDDLRIPKGQNWSELWVTAKSLS